MIFINPRASYLWGGTLCEGGRLTNHCINEKGLETSVARWGRVLHQGHCLVPTSKVWSQPQRTTGLWHITPAISDHEMKVYLTSTFLNFWLVRNPHPVAYLLEPFSRKNGHPLRICSRSAQPRFLFINHELGNLLSHFGQWTKSSIFFFLIFVLL